jgi:hypothetical protein
MSNDKIQMANAIQMTKDEISAFEIDWLLRL